MDFFFKTLGGQQLIGNIAKSPSGKQGWVFEKRTGSG